MHTSIRKTVTYAGLLATLFIGQLFGGEYAPSQTITLDEIITRARAAAERQRAQVRDIRFDSELKERRLTDAGEVKEEKRFLKQIYMATGADTASRMRLHEKFLVFYKDNTLQDEDALLDEISDKIERKKKRKGNDLATSLAEVFDPKHRDAYTFAYRGIDNHMAPGFACHVVEVKPKLANDTVDRIVGALYVDTATCHIAYADFRPNKLPSNLMFKIKDMQMQMRYAPTEDGIWLPTRFELNGKATAGLFFGIRFQTVETYLNPVINSGFGDSLFATVMSM